ncbi:PIN-like domain-containing protein [Nocardia tengchongensis]|uniref:PIN-like domain-containing protein n=1 Tax=Nocardia tengchongensis TaxID=2055889 RepID=UPI0036B24781
MKFVLPEWYEPDEREIREFVVSGTIALDANVLLSLYRVSESQRKQILDALDKVADRIWIPYQVALEYQRNRLDVASGVTKILESIQSIPTRKLEELFADFAAGLDKLADEAASQLRDRGTKELVREEFRKIATQHSQFSESSRAAMTEAFDAIREKHAIDFSGVRVEDPVRAALDKLLTPDHVGSRPEPQDLEKLRSDASARIEKSIPPGYRDSKKPDPTGDVLIWFELLEHARTTKRQLMFVTDDVKDDFYRRVHGQTIGPRVELVEEMRHETGQFYHQTTLDGFLRLANTHLAATVTEETIDTLVVTRQQREEVAPQGSENSEEGDSASDELEVYMSLLGPILDGERELTDAEKTIADAMAESVSEKAFWSQDCDTLRHLIEIQKKQNGDGSPAVYEAIRNLALCLSRRSRGDDLSESLNLLYELYYRLRGETDSNVSEIGKTARALASVHNRRGNLDAAIDVLDEFMNRYKGHSDSAIASAVRFKKRLAGQRRTKD